MFTEASSGLVITKTNEADTMLRLHQTYTLGIYDALFNLRHMLFGGIRIIGQEVSRHIG